MTKTGQELIESAKEALAFARGEANECVVYYKLNNDLTMNLVAYNMDKASNGVLVLPFPKEQKTLFIPLKTEYFNAFKDGTKTHELRVGNRWNEKHCTVGRKVVLSKGYGNHERLNGKITSFEVVSVNDLPNKQKIDVCTIYNGGIYNVCDSFKINKIGIEVLK
jgi:hypothetical protein